MQIKNKIRILILTLFFFSGFSSIEPLKSNLNAEQEISKTNYLERIPRDDYLLGPGDLLTISIADALPELVGSYRVQGDGTVFLPKINKVYVQGLTVTDLDSHITLLRCECHFFIMLHFHYFNQIECGGAFSIT